MLRIAEPSMKSLLIEMKFDGQTLSTGTAFIVKGADGPLLITNRHNVTGRHQKTNEPLSTNGGIPNEILIVHNKANTFGKWINCTEPILDQHEKPLWIEHPMFGSKADFVALPLTQTTDIKIFPYDLVDTNPDLFIGPADPVSVVGFPFGIKVGESYAVWATGFMASEPDINFEDLPVFLIDCRSRQGQSGSAVIAYRSGGPVALRNGGTKIFGNPITKFLGIYSGRVNSESDIGIVWKASAIKELVDSI